VPDSSRAALAITLISSPPPNAPQKILPRKAGRRIGFARLRSLRFLRKGARDCREKDHPTQKQNVTRHVNPHGY